MSEFSEGMAVGQAIGNNGNGVCYYPNMGGGFGNGFGNDSGWWILLLLLAGWGGNRGWGNGTGVGCEGVGALGYELGKVATTNDVASGFSTSAIMSNQRDLQLGQQQGFADVQQTLCQGFSGVNATVNTVGNQINQGICNLGYTVQGNFNTLGHQISDCCCKLERGIDSVNFNAERNACDIKNAIFGATRDIIDSQHHDTDRIIGFLTNQEMDRLRSRVQTLEFERSQANQNAYIAANQEAQTAELLRRLGRDCPTPAYIVPNPNCCYDYRVTPNNCCCG